RHAGRGGGRRVARGLLPVPGPQRRARQHRHLPGRRQPRRRPRRRGVGPGMSAPTDDRLDLPGIRPRRWTRIKAIAIRHAYVLRRSPHRSFDVFVWPVVDVLLWGSLGVFVAQQGEAGQAGAEYLLSGILLFHVPYPSQIALSTGFLEEVWSRNLLNFMTTPCSEWEYAVGVALFGLAKVATGLAAV